MDEECEEDEDKVQGGGEGQHGEGRQREQDNKFERNVFRNIFIFHAVLLLFEKRFSDGAKIEMRFAEPRSVTEVWSEAEAKILKNAQLKTSMFPV